MKIEFEDKSYIDLEDLGNNIRLSVCGVVNIKEKILLSTTIDKQSAEKILEFVKKFVEK